MFNGQRRRLVALAAKNALPTMYGDKVYAEAGGLIAYGPSYSDLYQRAATYVDKILKGAKPAVLAEEVADRPRAKASAILWRKADRSRCLLQETRPTSRANNVEDPLLPGRKFHRCTCRTAVPYPSASGSRWGRTRDQSHCQGRCQPAILFDELPGR